jgi:hypothetical protein
MKFIENTLKIRKLIAFDPCDIQNRRNPILSKEILDR